MPGDTTSAFIARDVMAVVVSYRGGDKIVRTIERLAPQVGLVHVVDNGSDAHTVQQLAALRDRGLMQFEALAENHGLGHALNLGAHKARALGFRWLLTMDQDSVPAADMVRELLVRANEGLRCLSPNLSVHGEAPASRREGPVAYAITSGNLVHIDVWSHAGPYNEGYFIDCIDFDFCLRARRRGYEIHKVAGALLHHELGEKAHLPHLPAFARRHYTQHPPLRRYYMFRNYLYLARTHFLHAPAFIGKLFVSHVLLLVLMLVAEPRLGENLRFIARGIVDFLRGRTGAYVEPGSTR
jgi:rhamnosyltransferase